MRDIQRFYILTMMMITAKRRQGTIKKKGILRALKVFKTLSSGK